MSYLHFVFYRLGVVENTLYDDSGAGVRFTKLNNTLANQFPPEKLEHLKFLLICKC